MSHKILLLMSGSIASYKACHVISKLVQQGHEVEIVASPWALEFVGEATLEGLTGRPVHQSMFGSGAHMSHIHLVRWADLVLVCPATANTINKLANGIGDDLMTTLFLAHDFQKPWLIAPAMNSKMYHHPVTQQSVQKLAQMGCQILETASGVLACGEIGDGKLLEPDLLLEAVNNELGSRTQRQVASPSQAVPKVSYAPKILITSGGTEEPIDQVRSITNTSTGKTGRDLTEVFVGLGYDVTLLKAKGSVGPLHSRSGLKVLEFRTFQELSSALKRTLQDEHFAAVLHAAAVSDFHVESIDGAPTQNDGKIDSNKPSMTLLLRKNPKLLDSLKTWSKNPEIKVVAFKFTAGDGSPASEQDRNSRVAAIAHSDVTDLLVTNDVATYPRWELHATSSGATRILDSGGDRSALAFAIEQALNRNHVNDGTSNRKSK